MKNIYTITHYFLIVACLFCFANGFSQEIEQKQNYLQKEIIPNGTIHQSTEKTSGSSTSETGIDNQNESLLGCPTSFSFTTTNTCGNTQTGTITITGVTGGTSPYTYSINGGGYSSNNFFTGLWAGSHYVTVKDFTNCTYAMSVTVNYGQGITGLQLAATNATCYANNGILSVSSINGGTYPFQFSMNGVIYNSNPVFPNLSPNTYTVYAIDANGCTISTSGTVANIPPPVPVQITVTNATCNYPNGVISVDYVSGGTLPFTYSINGGTYSPSPYFVGLTGGSYSISIKDASNCYVQTSRTVVNIPGPSQLQTITTSSTCGNPNGTMNVNSINGGTNPFQFSLNSGTYSQNSNFTGLISGNYTITVKDANNCTLSSSKSVENIAGPMDIITTSTNTTCGNSNGTLTIQSVIGGTMPFLYSFDMGNFGTTTVFTDLIADSYMVSASDANGCIFSKSVTVNNTAGPIINTIATEIQCNGGTSQVEVTASGGTLPIQGLGTFTVSAGTYDYAIYDANGCISNTSISISEPTALVVTSSTTEISCNSSNNGTASVFPTGGTSPLSIHWSNNSALYNTTNLSVGIYSVTVTDANGCTATTNNTVTWVGPCDTKVRNSECGITVNNFAKYIYCDLVAGATDYEWEFTSGTFSFSRTKGNESTGFYLAWVSGIEFSKTYDVKVRAYKNGRWGSFSTVCQITTGAVPTTKLRSDYCGINVNSMTQYLYCENISGASDYEWEFTNTSDNYSFTKTRNTGSNSMLLSWITGLEFNKTYDVKVRVKVGSQWGSFGTVCTITTPAIPSTKVQTDYCGTTAASLSSYFYCNPIAGATNYEWEFTNTATETITLVAKGTSSYSLSFASVNGAVFNVTYDVRVRAKIGTQWGEFGTICQLSTPAFPSTQLRADLCGITATSLNQYIYCDAVKGALDYEWLFENSTDNFSFAKKRGLGNASINLNQITGLLNGKTYTVSVRAKVGTQWGSFGTTCTISTPAGTTQRTLEDSNAKSQGSNVEVGALNLELGSLNFNLFPNPVIKGRSFVVELESDNQLNGTTVSIFNIIGQIVYTKTIDSDTNIFSFNVERSTLFTSGLYIVQAVQHGTIARKKLIVK